MHILYAMARFFPLWALPIAFILFELGMHMRRRKQDAQWSFFVSSGTLVLLSLLWFIFGGFSNSDRWIRSLTG